MISRKKWLRRFLVFCAVGGVLLPLRVDARDAARGLRRLKGYCIADGATISEVLTSRTGERYLRLDDGSTFKDEFLLLDPLPITDVIIFTRPLPEDLIDEFKGKVSDACLYNFKLLTDNEVFDAQPVSR